jgi:hypothetical protein
MHFANAGVCEANSQRSGEAATRRQANRHTLCVCRFEFANANSRILISALKGGALGSSLHELQPLQATFRNKFRD